MDESRIPEVIPSNQTSNPNQYSRGDEDRKPSNGSGIATKLKFFSIGFFVGCVVLILAMWLGALSSLTSFLFPHSSPEVTTEFVMARLESASDLTTARLIYSSVSDYEEGSVPIVNRSAFSMFYSATVAAGINVTDIVPEVTDTQVILKLPACVVRDVNIDSSSIRFFNQESGWFTQYGEREQVREALVQASEEVRHQDMSELLDLADEQLEDVMRGLFESTIGERELVITRQKQSDTTAADADVSVDGKQVKPSEE